MTAWHDVALEEYKALRAEVLTAMQMQYTTLTFGTATIGVLFGFGANVWKAKEPLAAEIVFLAAVPILAYLVLVIWMGELTRMIRAGAYVAFLEVRINRAVGERALGWETFLHGRDDADETRTEHRRWNRAAIFFLYAAMAAAAIALGWDRLSERSWQVAVPITEFLAFALVSVFLYWQWCAYLGRANTFLGKAFGRCCTSLRLPAPAEWRTAQATRMKEFHESRAQ